MLSSGTSERDIQIPVTSRTIGMRATPDYLDAALNEHSDIACSLEKAPDLGIKTRQMDEALFAPWIRQRPAVEHMPASVTMRISRRTGLVVPERVDTDQRCHSGDSLLLTA
jgi:hypothetical protein